MELIKNSNFLKLIIGRLVTNIGDSVYTVATMWLIYDLTHSTFYTGLAGFLTMFPQGLQFLTGPIVDKINNIKILLFSQISQLILILTIPILYYIDLLTVTLVLVIMPIVSFINQFSFPAQSNILPMIVKREQLTTGNTLMSVSYQGTEFIFNSVAGVLIGLIGAISLYILDAATFIIAIILFVTMKIPNKIDYEVKSTIKDKLKDYFSSLKEGITFVKKSVLKWFFLIAIVANFIIGMSFAVLPKIGDSLGGPSFYGYMLSAMAGGMLIGVILAPFAKNLPLGKLSGVLFLAGGLLWISSLITNNILTVILFGLAWVPIGLTNVLLFTFIQLFVPEGYMGRVISLMTSLSMALTPVGSLVGGILGDIYSPNNVFLASGSGLLLISLYCIIHPILRKFPGVNSVQPEKLGLKSNVS